jgi:prenyltransferase beta subunit
LYYLNTGVERINHNAAEIIRKFLKSQITDDGMFCNRAGNSDLYYTMFGLCCSIALGNIPIDIKRIKIYLNKININKLDLVHLASYIRIKLLIKLYYIPDFIRKFILSHNINLSFFEDKISIEYLIKIMKKNDNSLFPCYNKFSPYSLFLYLGSAQDCGLKLNKIGFIRKLKTFKNKNNTWRNVKEFKISSLNSTVASLIINRNFAEEIKSETIEFLKHQQCENGGFLAEKNAFVPDLLSTSTALFTLSLLNKKAKYSAEEFIKNHWLESGGFSGTVLDDLADCEYTFYGLLALGAM